MMKPFLQIVAFFIIVPTVLFAQEEHNNSNFNKWSIELNVGQNKPEKPFAAGYYSSDPTKYFNFNGVEHFDIGARYMFNPYFGAKLDFAYDIMKNQDGTSSLPFETKQYRVGLQGVVNISRLLKFESFTNRFGLLVHGGLQVSQLAPKLGVSSGVTEDNGGLIIGVTPQLKLAKWIALTGDFSLINNVRQHFNWDGSFSNEANNLTGTLFNTSLGLTFYLGKKQQHADWYFEVPEAIKVDTEARKRLDGIETLMNDTDKDGVPDYLDFENNTPGGVAVDTRGRFIDTNKNGVPDEIERKNNDGRESNYGEREQVKQDVIKQLVENGYTNIFFDVNQDLPNSGSTNNVYYIVKFMRDYPEAKIELNGFADFRGNEKENFNLSERRVQKVYNLLIGSGIQANRIQIKGNGVDKSFNDNPLGFNLARRVSVTIK